MAEIHDRPLGFSHRGDHDHGEGEQGHKDGSGAKQPHERRRQGPEALYLQGIETRHGVGLPLHPEFLQDGEAEGDRQQDHAESPGHGGVPAHLADELVVGLNGQDPKVFSDQAGDPEVLVASGDVTVGGVFHGDSKRVFPGGHALVDQDRAVEDLGVGDELVETVPPVELIKAVDLGIGGTRLFRVGHDDLALPCRRKEVLPGLGPLAFLNQGLVDHDDHDVGVARRPASLLLHVTRR